MIIYTRFNKKNKSKKKMRFRNASAGFADFWQRKYLGKRALFHISCVLLSIQPLMYKFKKDFLMISPSIYKHISISIYFYLSYYSSPSLYNVHSWYCACYKYGRIFDPVVQWFRNWFPNHHCGFLWSDVCLIRVWTW